MNTRLLRKVAKHISEEPRRLDMDEILIGSNAAPCGTVGCIAGWTCKLSEIPRGDVGLEKAAGLLGLNHDEKGRLFAEPKFAGRSDHYGGNTWPLRFAKRYLNAKTPEGRVSATLARIEHFIKTKGRE